VTPTKRVSKTSVATAGTRVAASGLSSTQAKTRKETSSIATTKKATTIGHKMPVPAQKKKDTVSPPNETKESTVKSDVDHPTEVLDDKKEIQQPADAIDEIKSTIVTEEGEESHAQEADQEDKSTIEQVDITVAEEISIEEHQVSVLKEEQEEVAIEGEQVNISKEEQEVAVEAEQVNISKEEKITITEQEFKQEESTLETIKEQVIVTEPVEKEVESVIVNQPKQAENQTNTNASSDAEVAAITQTNITNNKPQMASLRSRFENLNNNINNINQLHTTPSKEIRSKSPNKISDMINRFTAN
jgi:hypothetical protein